MIPGIMAGQMRLATSAALWTPLNMATVPQIYLDAEDSVVTDVSGFASAISNLGAMGASGDFLQATAGNRPTILAAALNGKQVLSFNGTSARLIGSTASQKGLFRNVGSAWVYAVVKKRVTDGADTNRVVFSASIGTSSAARFLVDVGSATAGTANKPVVGARRTDAGVFSVLSSPASVAGNYFLLMFEVNYSTRAGRIYLNGGLSAENLTLIDTAGTTSDTDSQEPLVLGALPSQASGFPDMDLAALVISNTLASAADIDRLFGWSAHKYGLTASLPGGHPYKSVAPTV